MADTATERIYVGGLDPARGLTVDLVASRLRSIAGVDVLSINDVTASNKRTIVDVDGDVVDTRNFFYLQARASDASSSALELIAKQYNGVKWKGCQLRVEAARPHFLQRLEEERAQRAEQQQKIHTQVDETEPDIAEEKAVKQPRRRLRVRKRFGEEAFHVDTLPHPLEQSNDSKLWDDFAFLHDKMSRKRSSQQQKLVERRKAERRLWASGKGKKGANPHNDSAEGGSDLNGLIFLNRGIHIRFSDGMDQDSLRERDVVEEAPEPVNRVEEDGASDTSSSVVSSDSEESSEQGQLEAKGEGKSYVWSDEEEDDAEEDVEEKPLGKEKYAWSNDEEGASGSSDDKDIGQQYNAQEMAEQKDVAKLMDGSKYTKAAVIDEFSGGMDFGDASESDDDHSLESEDDSGIVDNHASERFIEDGDICSNLDVLSKLFPGESFDQKPLVASLADGGADGGNIGSTAATNTSQSSSTFGAGMIMQRYDPTKESDKRFEVPTTDKPTSDIPNRALEEKVDKDESDEEQSVADDASASSERSNEDGSKEQGDEHEGTQEKQPVTEAGDKQTKIATNVDGKVVPAKDVYEQNKLEDIFKRAREGKSESFSLANMFQNEEKAREVKEEEREVYEQDKLENVFKQARDEASPNAGAGGFSFGFQSQLPEPKAGVDTGASFSFGFDTTITPEDERDESTPKKVSDKSSNENEAKADMVLADKKLAIKRKRRGMLFPESDLDKYEAMFFSLNEGPQILKDFNAMKQDEQSQEQWQKERAMLTADWKRKQKAALSRGPKKQRRV